MGGHLLALCILGRGQESVHEITEACDSLWKAEEEVIIEFPLLEKPLLSGQFTLIEFPMCL